MQTKKTRFLGPAALSLFALSGTCLAQVPPVAPGFPNALTCTPGQLLHRDIGYDRTTNIIYHNGRLYSNDVGGGGRREWLFSNPNDPTSLSVVSTTLPGIADHGNHGHSKVGDYAGGGQFYLRRVSPGVNANFDALIETYESIQLPPPGAFGLHHLYYPWAVPFHPINYSPSAGTARLWRADQLLGEWDALVEQGVAGNGVLMGNLLFIVSDQSMLGILAYDIAPMFESPPRAPQLLDKLTGAVGGYLGPAIWENYLLMVGGPNQDEMIVVDYSDPSNLRLAATIDLTGTPALNAGSNVPYLQTQDQYVFTRRHKIDMEQLRPVLELDEVGAARPAGSVAGQLDVSQYLLPLGNLLISGGYSFPGRDGIGVWCHQAGPDTRSPYVGYHVPRPEQTNFPLGAPISLFVSETLESFTIVNGTSIILRPLGGAPVDAWTSFAHDRILTLTPREYLQPNTTYEVVVAAGGIKDAAGNGIEGYSFRFSTGASASGGNAAPTIASLSADGGPVSPGTTVSFNAMASDAEGDSLQYRYTFGDGSPPTGWQSAAGASHQFDSEGHFEVKLQVRDLKPDGTRSVVVDTLVLTVAALPSGAQPTHSSSISLDESRRYVWAVDPDNDALIRYNADTGAVSLHADLRALTGATGSVHPLSVAVVQSSGEVWVAARDLDRVLVLSSAGSLLASIDTGYGSAPQAVAIQRDGSRAFVSLARRGTGNRDNGQLIRYSTATRSETGRLELGPTARAIALSGDGSRAFVGRLISAEHFGEIWDINTSTMSLTRTIRLRRDRGVDGLDAGGSDGPGVPNYLSSLVLSPQQDWLWYTAIKADTNRGEYFDLGSGFNAAASHDTTTRPVLGRVQITGTGAPREPGVELDGAGRPRVDIDNSDSPSALVFTPRGDYAFAALQGNDTIAVFDDLAIRAGAGRSSVWRLPTGAAPQGLLWDASNDTLWSQDFLGRGVSRFALGEFLAVGRRDAAPSSTPSGVSERLGADILAGKRHFYFAGNALDGANQMGFEGYISCASCHLDGGHDGRTWDFTQRGEGLRNTTSLHGRAGMAHGNVHWTANFDEIQDFVNDIVHQFRGLGFLAEGESPHPPLGTPNAGRSTELDQLAAYVSSLDHRHLPKSPWRSATGELTAAAQAGAAVFQSSGCASCHRPQQFYTDSSRGTATLHDVGTLRDSSGGRLGASLTGIDTPSLLGAWDTAPYLHDGSAAGLNEVFTAAGGQIVQAETAQLLGGAFMDDFPQFNSDSSAHGRYVQGISNPGDGVRFNNVDGGSGGNASLELRVLPSMAGTLRLVVNGSTTVDRVFTRELSYLEWTRMRFDDIPLLAGASNTVTVTLLQRTDWGELGIDELTVGTSNTLSRAAPHRIVNTLGSTERSHLLAFLRELDGRDANGQLQNPVHVFGNGFE
ncbi:Ig-like domain-containing protein [Pseudomarimonas arenosa]|uniref:Ig-like domain-containing protein n=1 Tax=Pseudomarimonas arenosa TaxID=2774145 RepID=A0AAW3ZHT0_9GAMM|nr:Ig-like domain-containing protein [Pseudomarimonas arenosa]MBD8525645.1 Ig-like domain-containing protein [Pseudomarimonas arenosa]